MEILLSAREIDLELKSLKSEWVLVKNNQMIECLIPLNNFNQGISVIQSIGLLAEESWHHPELTLSFKTLLIRIWTHEANGLTKKDFELARQIEKILA